MENKIFIVNLLSILLSSFGYSQNNFDLVENFDYSSNSYLNGIDTVTENLGQYGVLNKTFTFSSSLSSISVELELNSPVIFSRQDSHTNIHGQNEWIGISNSPNCVSCKLHLVESSNIIEGSLFKTNRTIGISYIGESNYLFYERSNGNSDCDTHLFPTMSFNIASSARISSGECQTANAASMIIAYTPEFASTFSSTNRQDRINDFLTSIIQSINESYINSDLNVRVRLAFSYQTPDSEYGNKDDDFDSFINVVKDPLFGGEKWRKYDEIFGYRDEFNAEISILLVSGNIGGRAERGANMAISGKSGANWAYIVAHEIGHMLDLEHNREEFSWIERIFLDGKRAYGYRGSTYKTVMSYGSQTVTPLYSDYRYEFPDGNIAGDNDRAKARDYASGHLGRILKSADPSNLEVKNRTLLGTETATFIATSDVSTENFVTNSNSRVQIEAPNSITLKSGTHLQNGSTALIRIAGNSSDLSSFFNEGISIIAASSPTCSNPCVNLKIDGYRDDFTFKWFQDDSYIGCDPPTACSSTTELGVGQSKSVCFANTEGDPNEQRTFRVVVTDLSRCTLGEIYFDGKLYCGTNFRAATPLNVEKEKINTFAVYPNPTPNKKFKLLINNDNLNNYKISIRNLGGVIVLTRRINNQENSPLEIDLSDKPSGMYIINCCANTNECFSHKIILE